ncbi:T9SS type A sorting domain-containing protein [Hymenobacter ruricola]|uniref:T9SS type A sorting domain-containing protein n=1 Tax=Hymenobacter ruricola TaxID=2791023 RepID=A0ABS0I8B2_9BACT|nr:T9SS type A sorting domain-containing protein [Hymenobacter ruricola]MBF9222812.1 T9SS type A sorting domain-containing protein [Hymenobacter ruricola]
MAFSLRFLCLLAAFFITIAARAQAPAWTRVATGAPNPVAGTVVPQANAADAAGNVYVTGYFTGRVEVGGSVVESTGGQDVFVAKWNPTTAAWVWVRTAGGARDDRASALAVSGGNVYVAGSFGATGASFGSTTLSSAGGLDMFVAKLSDAGTTATWGWAVRGGGSDDDERAATLTARGSNVYVAGDYSSGDAVFGSTPLIKYIGPSNVFIAKLTDGGSSVAWNWVQNIPNGGLTSAGGLGVSSGGVYLTGTYTGTASFGTRNLVPVGATDVYVAKLNDANGAWTWAYSGGGALNDNSTALAVTGNTVYIAGDYNSYNFRLGTAVSLPAISSAGADVFVAKLTDAGTTATWNWANRTVGNGSDKANGLAIGAAGTVYLGGTIQGTSLAFSGLPTLANTGTNTADGFVAQLTDAGASSAWAWAQASGGTDEDNLNSIAANATTVFVTGVLFSATATFGSALNSPLQTGGQNTLVMGALSPTGTWLAVQSVNPGGAYWPGAVASLPSDDAYVTGRFSGRVDFGSTRLVSRGRYDVFVARWDARRGTWAWAIGAGGPDSDSGSGIALGPDGVLVSGLVTGGASFGGITVPNRGNNDAFVAKVNEASGAPVWAWAVSGGGNSDEGAAKVAVDGRNVYLSGFYTETATFGTTALPRDANNRANGFVTKLLDGGNAATWAWATSCASPSNDYVYDVLASGGSVYVCGGFGAATATFGGLTLTSAGANDAYVAKLTDNGSSATWAWALRTGGTGTDEAMGLALNGNNLYVAGTTNGPTIDFGSTRVPTAGQSDVYVAKVNLAGTTPTWAWGAVAGSPTNESVTDLALRGNSLYVTGYFQGPLSIGGSALAYAGSNDAFLAKLIDNGTAGTWAWGTSGGGPRSDAGQGVAVGNQTIYMAAALDGPATFGPIAVPNTGTSAALATIVDTALPLAIQEGRAGSAPLALAPNPALEAVAITLPAAVEARAVTVLDALGRTVRRATLPALATTLTLPVAGLAPGVYVVRAGEASGRLLIE